MRIAITRGVSPNLADCELTHLDRQPIDHARARRQHAEYEACLSHLGCRIVGLPADADLPDSVFIEDAAIVLDEVAIITRPGAASRRPEVVAVEALLERYRPIARIEPPGTIEGGDVLRGGRQLFVGQSSRTNRAGLAQLRSIADPFGYSVSGIAVRGCLHLKSAVTLVGEQLLLMNPAWVDPHDFPGFDVVTVSPDEPYAANGLLVGDTLIYPTAFPWTRARLEARGIRVIATDVSELAKAEGAVTCCSLVFDGPA